MRLVEFPAICALPAPADSLLVIRLVNGLLLNLICLAIRHHAPACEDGSTGKLPVNSPVDHQPLFGNDERNSIDCIKSLNEHIFSPKMASKLIPADSTDTVCRSKRIEFN